MREPDAQATESGAYEYTPEDQFGIKGSYATKHTRKGRLARGGAHLPWRHCGTPLRGPAMCCFLEGGSSASPGADDILDFSYDASLSYTASALTLSR